MSILSGLTPPPKNPCAIAKLATGLSKEDKAILLEAAVDPRWSLLGLANELTARGLKINRASIERHRKNLCGCNA